MKRTIIASITVLAVAAAAVLVGLWFARPAPASVPVAPAVELESLPVFGPASYGDDEVIESIDGSLGTMDVVADPVETGFAPEDAALIAALDTADDPRSVLAPAEEPLSDAADLGVFLIGGADDPCADAEGDCPSGVRSTVLALYGAEAMQTFVEVNPPNYLDDPHAKVQCEWDGDSGSVMFGVAVNKPAAVTAEYWALDDEGEPTGESIVVPMEQDAAEVADWQAHRLSSDYSFSSYWIQSCANVPDLEEGVQYVAWFRTDAADSDQTDSQRRSFLRRAGGNRPPTEVLPINAGLMYVTTVHEVVADATITARVLDATPDRDLDVQCEVEGGLYLDPADAQSTTTIRNSWLDDHGYDRIYSQRSSVSFSVPEGARIVVCVSTSKPDDPTWVTAGSHVETFQVLSPDRTVPRFSVVGASAVDGSTADGLVVEVNTVEGQYCGRAAETAPRGEYAVAANLVSADFFCDFSDETRSWGTEGSVVLSGYQSTRDTNSIEERVLNLAAVTCWGVCLLPPTANYQVNLGSGDSRAGSATVRVAWDQGRTNGQTEWSVTRVDTAWLGSMLAALPQLDTGRTWQPLPGFTPSLTKQLTGRIELVPDRPVSYVATLLGECFLDDGPEPTTRELRGAASGPVDLDFGNLCLGEQYGLEVVLNDGDGGMSVFSTEGAPGVTLWPGANWISPPNTQNFRFLLAMEPLDDADRQYWLIDSVQLWIDGVPYANLAARGTCMGSFGLQGITEATIGLPIDADVTITVSAWPTTGNLIPDLGGPSECVDVAASAPTYRTTFSYPLDLYDLTETGPQGVRADMTGGYFRYYLEISKGG